MKRGYYGIALFEPKTTENLGTVLRSAHNFDCNFICLIGARYKKQASDTTDAKKHIPIFEFETISDFLNSIPKNCVVVRCEVDGKTDLGEYKHPESCVYIFGGEDRSVPEIRLAENVKINTKFCLNLATTTSIFMYDRQNKNN